MKITKKIFSTSYIKNKMSNNIKLISKKLEPSLNLFHIYHNPTFYSFHYL